MFISGRKNKVKEDSLETLRFLKFNERNGNLCNLLDFN